MFCHFEQLQFFKARHFNEGSKVKISLPAHLIIFIVVSWSGSPCLRIILAATYRLAFPVTLGSVVDMD